MEDAAIGESTDYAKQEKARNEKIKQLFKDLPNNDVVKEMYEEVLEDEQEQANGGISPFSYVHEAVWAAEESYRDGASFSKACADLCEAIDACTKFVNDSKQFKKSTTKATPAKGSGY